MDAVVRYVVATLMAVVGGWVGYHFVSVEPFGVVGNTVFVGALFGLFMGLGRVTGFFGNVVNAFLLSFPLWYVLPGGWFIIWTGGNVGYAVGNVFGQLVALSSALRVRSL
jgi:mannose/fructose/N-acetylgalactosamine-specific phosphotransferase system component IID